MHVREKSGRRDYALEDVVDTIVQQSQILFNQHGRGVVSESPGGDGRFWIPDNPDGSGWADVDWTSAVSGSRYHYRHVGSAEDERVRLPPYYRVVMRLESETLHPHENSYFVPRERLADFLAEVSLAGGAEVIWHVEACPEPPPESRVAG